MWAPNRSHRGCTGATLLSPTGWLRVKPRAGIAANSDAAEATDYERVLEQIIDAVERHAWPAQEPYFERLDIRVDLPGIEQPLPVGHECIDSHEALHEDIYFSLLEIFQRRSGRAAGDRRLQPGQIVPDVRTSDAGPRLRIAVAGFERAAESAASQDPAADAAPLEQLETAPTAGRVASEMALLRGHRFGASSRQGRAVRGVYQRGSGPAVFISGGQHANETSGVVGALRAARMLRSRPTRISRWYRWKIRTVMPCSASWPRATRVTCCTPHATARWATTSSTASSSRCTSGLRANRRWPCRRRNCTSTCTATRPTSGHGRCPVTCRRASSCGPFPRASSSSCAITPDGSPRLARWCEQVSASLAQVAGLADYNARQLALYERHAGALPFEVLHGTACAVSQVDRPGAPVTLITEFPDETIDGEAFRFAHTIQTEAALAAVRAWKTLARR